MSECVRGGCGLPAVLDMTLPSGKVVSLCDCCSEVLINWLKGHGEFYHGSWELKMITENAELYDRIRQMETRTWFQGWISRVIKAFGG